MHTSIRLWCLVWGVMTFPALTDLVSKANKVMYTMHIFVGNNWGFFWDVSWILNYWKTQKLLKLFTKLSKLSKFIKLVYIRVYFQFMGLGRFSECGLVYCLFWLRRDITIYINIHITITCKLTTSSVCANQSLQIERVVHHLWFICLCHGSVYCASMPDVLEVCQHARGSSLKCLCFPGCFLEVPAGPRCPEGQDIVPLCQMAQTSQDCT